MLAMNPVVYKIEFPDGSHYIGCTVNFSARRQAHLSDKRKGTAVNPLLRAAFAEHPVCGIYVVACGFDRETLHKLEALVMASDPPTLNVNQAPTRIPDAREAGPRSWGPYETLRDAAKNLGLSYTQIKRISKFSFESAVYKLAYRRPKPQKLPREPSTYFDQFKVSVDGVLDLPANHCRRAGISIKLYHSRVRDGHSRASALRSKCVPPPERKLTAGGKTMTLKQWSKYCGVRKNTLRSRLDSLGWSPEQAVGIDPPPGVPPGQLKANILKYLKKVGKLVEYQGVEDSFVGHCQRLGVQYPRAYHRYKRGLPLDQVFVRHEQ